jgi:hypothetical protein
MTAATRKKEQLMIFDILLGGVILWMATKVIVAIGVVIGWYKGKE